MVEDVVRCGEKSGDRCSSQFGNFFGTWSESE